MHQKREWSRDEAEKRVRELFDDAKSGAPQTVRDEEGMFEVRFIARVPKEPIGQFLARGGPDKD